MKKLTVQLKEALAALAYADAGEMLSGSEKDRILRVAVPAAPSTAVPLQHPGAPAGTSSLTAMPPPQPPPAVTGLFAGRKQVGLYLGASLDGAVLRYAAETCRELDAALTVVTFQSEDRVRALLAPYLDKLGRDRVAWRIARLSGEPRASLVRYLKGEPRMLFLVATESGFLGHTLLSGAGRRFDPGLPVVLVATEHTPPAPGPRAVA